MPMNARWITTALLALGSLSAVAAPVARDAEQRCTSLEASLHERLGFQVVKTVFHSKPAATEMPMAPGVVRRIQLPAHCEVIAASPERVAADGQRYAIRFHLRMPVRWNQRFVFQGGGGSDGELGDAYGRLDAAGSTAIERGYAVLSQDSGHDNARNTDPLRNGEMVFGFDPTARADYGHTSLKRTADAGLWLIDRYYGRKPRYTYFVGCSKGGQEGMAFAQRYPEVFDGIVAMAPGLSLPKAALAEAWDTRLFAGLTQAPSSTAPADVMQLHTAFSRKQLGLVREAILEACDADDGLRDGIVADITRCTEAKVVARLRGKTCPADGAGPQCLRAEQVQALVESTRGPRDASGRALYSPWFWPSGIDHDLWRLWKVGLEDGSVPALNVVVGARALASIFTTPPTALAPGLQPMLDYQTSFDFGRDAAKIQAVAAPFEASAWDDISARSTDLSRFKARGGRLVVPHGESDPVFSLADTLRWFDDVDAREDGRARDFVRVFPVPGMCHCGGGPATDDFDAFAALVRWVEQGRAPDRIEARAGAGTPWPGRTRPLCAYPQVARYRGRGDPEKSSSFVCTR